MELNTTRTKTRDRRLWWTNLEDLSFAVYLCSTITSQAEEHIYTLFLRIAFVVYFGFIVLRVSATKTGIKINGYLKWLVLFYGYAAVTCLWADPEFSGNYFGGFTQITIITFGLSQRLKTPKDFERYLLIFNLSISYMVVMLYLKTPPWVWGTSEIGNVIGIHKNGVSLHAASGFIVSLFLIDKRRKLWRIVTILMMIIFAIVAVISASRKGLMMLPIGLALYWLLSQKRELLHNKNIGRTVFGFLMIVLVLWVGTRYIMNSDLLIAQRMENTVDIMVRGETSDDVSINERKFYIQKAEELFSKHPIFGAGINGFAAYMKEIHYSHVAYCHNNFWEILSTLGIVGFLIFYYMQAKCLYYGRPWRKEMQNIRPLAAVLWLHMAITVAFGWWWVYYIEILSNYLFILTYLNCYMNGSLPETKRTYNIKAQV